MKYILLLAAGLLAVGAGANGADSAYGVRLGGNQMPNGNFEGVGGWRTLGDYARIEKGAGRDGTTGFVVEKSAGAMINCPHSERIPVESGLAYRIEMWAKCLKGEGERLVPYVVAYDANGRENLNVGCRIARVTDNDPRDDGWYRFEGVTKAMPSNVRTAELVVWAPDKLEGAVAVDDIVVYPVSANTLGTVVCSAYQARASKGAVTFKAACSANAGRFPPDTLRAETVCTAGGRTDRRPATVRDGAVEATLPVGAFAFGRNEVVLRLFAKDGTELGSGACGFTRDREDPPRRVTIDRYGRTLVDGKPFLPLGLYFSKVTEENLTKLREGPFNCIMPYRPKEGDLDLCRRKGVMMIGSLSGWFRELRAATPEKAAEINGRLWDRVRRNREHPALLAWYLADEVPLAFEDLLRARNEKVHELDPSHPTWIVLDKPDHVAPLAQCFDVIGVDAYPIGNHGSAENTTIGKAAGWAERAKRTTYGFRPMWNVPQLFNWASYRKQEAEKNPAIRWPTEEEMRSMVWQSVAAGANGIVGYSFFDINERENYDEKTKVAKWAEVCRVFNEVKAHERELLSAPGPEPVCSDSGLVARTWSCEAGGTFVLVCNTLRKAVSGEVTVGGRKVPVSFGPIGVKTFTLGK